MLEKQTQWSSYQRRTICQCWMIDNCICVHSRGCNFCVSLPKSPSAKRFNCPQNVDHSTKTIILIHNIAQLLFNIWSWHSFVNFASKSWAPWIQKTENYLVLSPPFVAIYSTKCAWKSLELKRKLYSMGIYIIHYTYYTLHFNERQYCVHKLY